MASTGGSALERDRSRDRRRPAADRVVLFFVVPIANAWVFFLLIPLGGILFAGSRGRRRDGGG